MNEKKLYLLISIVFFITVLGGCDGNNEWEEIAFRVGDYESILNRSEPNSIYRGLVYEYGIGVNKDINKAKEIYKKIDDKSTSNKRLFLLCFIYCDHKISSYYENIKNDNPDIDFLYSVYLLSKDESCALIVDDRMCLLATEIYSEANDHDPFYFIGQHIHKGVVGRTAAFEPLELPYYLLKKSEINGNDSAKKYLEDIPDGFNWVPKLN